MSAAVSAMSLTMLVQNDPSATVVLPAVTIPMTLVMGGLTVHLYRAYLEVATHVDVTESHPVQHYRVAG